MWQIVVTCLNLSCTTVYLKANTFDSEKSCNVQLIKLAKTLKILDNDGYTLNCIKK